MIAYDCIMIAKGVYLNNNLKHNSMGTFKKLLYWKLVHWAENTNDINELKDAFIEIITNNDVNLLDFYNDHKKSIDETNTKDLHSL